MTAPEPTDQAPRESPPARRRGRRPLLVLAGVVAALGIAGAATGITLAAVGSDGPGSGWGGPGHHRHGPPVGGPDGGRFGPDRLVPPDQD